jgi:hypothetical protein
MSTSEATAVVLEGEPSVLWEAGGYLLLLPESSAFICFFIRRSAILLSVMVGASSEDFWVFTNDDRPLEREFPRMLFILPSPIVAQTVALRFATVVSAVTIRCVKIPPIVNDDIPQKVFYQRVFPGRIVAPEPRFWPLQHGRANGCVPIPEIENHASAGEDGCQPTHAIVAHNRVLYR